MILTVGLLVGLLCLALQAFACVLGARYYGWAAHRRVGLGHPLSLFGRFAVLMGLLMFGNVVQITIWAVLYRMLGAFEDFETALYFSGVTFTTLGYGDVVLHGRVRMLAPLQAANGMMMFGITSAAFIAAIQRTMIIRKEPSGA